MDNIYFIFIFQWYYKFLATIMFFKLMMSFGKFSRYTPTNVTVPGPVQKG